MATLHAADALVQVEILVALAALQVFKLPGLFFEHAAQGADLVLQFLHLDNQVGHHLRIGVLRLGRGG